MTPDYLLPKGMSFDHSFIQRQSGRIKYFLAGACAISEQTNANHETHHFAHTYIFNLQGSPMLLSFISPHNHLHHPATYTNAVDNGLGLVKSYDLKDLKDRS